MLKYLFVVVFSMLTFNAHAALIEYRIIFTQTQFNVNVGERNLTGSFFVDDSILGAGNEDMIYDPYSPEMSALTNFTVTVDSPNYQGGGTRIFDLNQTRAVVAPPFSTVLATGSSGELIDIRGALVLPGTFSEIFLGRDGEEGTYVDIQQTGSTSSFPVSRGTYVIEKVSLIPIPAAVWLFSSGLLGLIGVARRRADA